MQKKLAAVSLPAKYSGSRDTYFQKEISPRIFHLLCEPNPECPPVYKVKINAYSCHYYQDKLMYDC